MGKEPKKRNALGKGLDALLSDAKNESLPTTIKSSAQGPALKETEINKIETNPFQPRTDFDEKALNELAESIKIHGIIQPITLRAVASGKYQLISGERRLQAAAKAGLKSIPAYIRSANDQQMLEMALIENIQRKDLNAIEIALSYQRLISECNLKQEELGGRVGKERSTITNYLRLLKLPPDIQIALRETKLSMGHARALVNIENVEMQLEIFNRILSDDLSVRKVEALVRMLMTKPSPKKSKQLVETDDNFEIRQLQSKLSSHFGTKVEVSSPNGEKGEIKIPFISVQELNRILEILDV